METDRIAAFARSIKGAPALCLIVMQLLNRRTGNEELSLLTGYTDKPVSKALELLELYGLAYHDSRFNGWQLTDKGRQLPLFSEQSLTESEYFRLGSSSSSFKESTDSIDSLKPLLQQKQIESEKFRLDLPEPAHPDLARLTDLLVLQTACPRHKAEKAVKAALADLNPLIVEYRILAWLGYCLSKNGKNLNPAHFVASRLQEVCSTATFAIADLAADHYELYLALDELERQLDAQEGCEEGDPCPD